MTSDKYWEVPDVRGVQLKPLLEVRIVPPSPTTTNKGDSVCRPLVSPEFTKSMPKPTPCSEIFVTANKDQVVPFVDRTIELLPQTTYVPLPYATPRNNTFVGDVRETQSKPLVEVTMAPPSPTATHSGPSPFTFIRSPLLPLLRAVQWMPLVEV